MHQLDPAIASKLEQLGQPKTKRVNNLATTVRNTYLIKHLAMNHEKSKNLFVKFDRNNIFFVLNQQKGGLSKDSKTFINQKMRSTGSLDIERLSTAEKQFMMKIQSQRRLEAQFSPPMMQQQQQIRLNHSNKSSLANNEEFQIVHVNQVQHQPFKKFFPAEARTNSCSLQTYADLVKNSQPQSQIKGSKLKGRLVKCYQKPLNLELESTQLSNWQRFKHSNKLPIEIDLSNIKAYLKPRYQSIQTDRVDNYEKKHGNFSQDKLFKQQMNSGHSKNNSTTRDLHRGINQTETQAKKNQYSVINLINPLNLRNVPDFVNGWEKSNVGETFAGEMEEYVTKLKFN